jgi:hypothetical protein
VVSRGNDVNARLPAIIVETMRTWLERDEVAPANG